MIENKSGAAGEVSAKNEKKVFSFIFFYGFDYFAIVVRLFMRISNMCIATS